MKILITYDPSNDAVLRTAKMVSELLRRTGAEIELVDISQKEIDILAPYDKLIIGGELWFGKFSANVQKYLSKNAQEILLKPTYLFVHAYANDEVFQEQLAKTLPLEVLAHAFTFNLGMNVDMDGLNPIEKISWKFTGQKAETAADDDLVKAMVSVIQG